MIRKPSDDERISCNIDGSNVNCVEMLSGLINLQWDRVVTLWEKEKDLHTYIAALSKEIKLCAGLLLALQKIRFDLGLDEYKGSTPVRRANAYSRRSQEEGEDYWKMNVKT
jgi:hypothetical protein